MTQLLIWTRSQSDWAQDRDDIDQAGLGGLEIVHLPLFEIQPVDCDARIRQKIAEWSGPVVYAFTSKNAVDCWLTPVENKTWVAHAADIFAVGEPTQRALRAHGFTRVQTPWDYSGEALGQLLVQSVAKTALVVCPGAQDRAYDLETYLTQHGLTCVAPVIYENIPVAHAVLKKIWFKTLTTSVQGIIALTSPKIVDRFEQFSHKENIQFHGFKAVVLGPTTEKACRGVFYEVNVAEQPKIPSLLATIKQLIS